MDDLELEFELDSRLAGDCIPLGKLLLCDLLLMNDSQYSWFILVPRRAGVTEIYHLNQEDQNQLMRETSSLAESVADLFAAEKMNIATLGNMVPQLHVHVIARKKSDPAWPKPVWGVVEPKSYTAEEIDELKSRLEGLIGTL